MKRKVTFEPLVVEKDARGGSLKETEIAGEGGTLLKGYSTQGTSLFVPASTLKAMKDLVNFRLGRRKDSKFTRRKDLRSEKELMDRYRNKLEVLVRKWSSLEREDGEYRESDDFDDSDLIHNIKRNMKSQMRKTSRTKEPPRANPEVDIQLVETDYKPVVDTATKQENRKSQKREMKTENASTTSTDTTAISKESKSVVENSTEVPRNYFLPLENKNSRKSKSFEMPVIKEMTEKNSLVKKVKDVDHVNESNLNILQTETILPMPTPIRHISHQKNNNTVKSNFSNLHKPFNSTVKKYDENVTKISEISVPKPKSTEFSLNNRKHQNLNFMVNNIQSIMKHRNKKISLGLHDRRKSNDEINKCNVQKHINSALNNENVKTIKLAESNKKLNRGECNVKKHKCQDFNSLNRIGIIHKEASKAISGYFVTESNYCDKLNKVTRGNHIATKSKVPFYGKEIINTQQLVSFCPSLGMAETESKSQVMCVTVSVDLYVAGRTQPNALNKDYGNCSTIS